MMRTMTAADNRASQVKSKPRSSGFQAHPFVQDLDLGALLLQRRQHVHARVIADAVDRPLLQLLVVATVGPRV